MPTNAEEPAELSIEVELDKAFDDLSEDEVPAPLPASRPEGLDLLDRLDSSRPLEIPCGDDTPPLFPDLGFESDPSESPQD